MRARITPSLCTVLVSGLLAGCGVGIRYKAPPPDNTSGPPIYRLAPGVGTIVQPGMQAGYGITGNTGGSYRIFWTGDSNTSGAFREFTGSVTSGVGITLVNHNCEGSCPLESGDSVTASADGFSITFDTFASDGLDGFDFLSSGDSDTVTFDLLIDGVAYPDLVFFPATDNGDQVSTVDSIPFGLIIQ